MITLREIYELHASFDYDLIFKDEKGNTREISRFGNNLIYYLAQPRIIHNGFNFFEAKRVLTERQHPDHLDIFKMAPNDVTIFKIRSELMASNNDAYRIAISEDPSVEDLIAFSYMKARWAILYPLKHYLMHHLEKAKKYTGLLPFGAPIINFVNTLSNKPKIIKSPDFSDHVFLQNISNKAAQLRGMTSIEINNEIYLEGKKIMEGKKEEKEDE
jgi:hypothetical protein